jgi:hypothetical protein
MESKKINQLATELTPSLSDLTIIGDPSTGISKKITLSQMASLFTGTVEEYANLASFPLVGVADTIYIALDTNIIYRWNTGTNAYVELSPNIVTSLVFNDANGFDGTISLVGSTATLTITTALTQGSVPFIGTSGALTQDNANLFFDDTNNRLGINTNAPTTALDVFGSGIIGRLNGTSTNNAYLGFASAGSNKWSIGNVQSDHRFRIFSETNTSELVTVLQTGEFGIGIANPTTKVHIDGGATALIANLDANVSVAKSVSFRSDNSNRFNIEVSGTESGSNAGADFFIRRYSDAGSLIDTPLTITRSTGNATFSGILTTPQVKAATSAGLSINANSGTQVADFGAGGSANMTLFGGLSGTSAVFSGTVTTNGTSGFTGYGLTTKGLYGIYIQRGSVNDSGVELYHDGSNTIMNSTYQSTGSFGGILFVTSSTTRLSITSSGAATFTNTNLTLQSSSYSEVRSFSTSTGDYANLIVDTDNTVNYRTQIVGFGTTAAGTLLGINRAGNGFLAKNGGLLAVGTRDSNALVFATTEIERMRINANGYLKIAPNGSYIAVNTSFHELHSNAQSSDLLYARHTQTDPYGLELVFSGATPNNTSNWWLYCADSTNAKAVIYSNGTFGSRTGTYGSIISDEKYKQDILDANSQWDDIKNLRVVNFKFKQDVELEGETALRQIGFIAQEVEKVSPNLVYESTDRDTGETWKSVKTSIIEIKAIKALQEAMAKIEILEEKVKQLELK